MKVIPKSYIDASVSYRSFRETMDVLLAEGKTTGDNHSPAMLEYTRLNTLRMNRLDRKPNLLPESMETLHLLEGDYIWLVITEAWCGDAAQSLPIMVAMAEESQQIELRLLLRDEHTELIDAFLTNGGRSIPKLLILERESLKVVADWGPRPSELQTYVQRRRNDIEQLSDKEERKQAYTDLGVYTQKWYVKDKARSIQREILSLMPVPIN